MPIVDRDTAGALTFLEELAEQGQDLSRLVTDLLEHLRHLLLVQHMGHVPDSLPVTDETRERLREQANQLPAPTVLRLCDLLAVAVEDSRQGADPRLPLELALVKVTSPGSDLSRESLAFRVEQLEQRLTGTPVAPPAAPRRRPPPPRRRQNRRRSRLSRRPSRRTGCRRRGAAARARPAAGRVAAHGHPRSPVALDPGRVAARAKRARRRSRARR